MGAAGGDSMGHLCSIFILGDRNFGWGSFKYCFRGDI
jgi:hypothetical protein